MSKNPKLDPCKANACKIQSCLKANNYQENKCLEVLELMRLCCVKWHKESFVCGGINLERSYLKVDNDQSTNTNKTTK